jgi:lipopolysaccharide/colanic/teichoic acid biosynthesis glycosyltransferase
MMELWSTRAHTSRRASAEGFAVKSCWAARTAALDRAARRTLDIVIALVVLVAALPVFVLIAIGVLVESPGPVLYVATRVGRDGEQMRMRKFRKMRDGASGLPLTAENDSRLTSLGRFLARTRLDELPQIWHVLRGEMSFVGPRPEDPVFVAGRAEDYEVILTVRPGLSGFSQLAFADECSILSSADPMIDYVRRLHPQKCALDRLYVERASVRTNVRVLWWTLVVTLLRRPVAVDRATGAIGRRRRLAPSAQPSVCAMASPAATLIGQTQPQANAATVAFTETAPAPTPIARLTPAAEASAALGGIG